MGGSHGGLLTGHLVGQHPSRFRCGVLRNPVLDISAMVHMTDIPDWCYVECWGSEVRWLLLYLFTATMMPDTLWHAGLCTTLGKHHAASCPGMVFLQSQNCLLDGKPGFAECLCLIASMMLFYSAASSPQISKPGLRHGSRHVLCTALARA